MGSFGLNLIFSNDLFLLEVFIEFHIEEGEKQNNIGVVGKVRGGELN